MFPLNKTRVNFIVKWAENRLNEYQDHDDIGKAALALFKAFYPYVRLKEISEKTGVNYSTIRTWAASHKAFELKIQFEKLFIKDFIDAFWGMVNKDPHTKNNEKFVLSMITDFEELPASLKHEIWNKIIASDPPPEEDSYAQYLYYILRLLDSLNNQYSLDSTRIDIEKLKADETLRTFSREIIIERLQDDLSILEMPDETNRRIQASIKALERMMGNWSKGITELQLAYINKGKGRGRNNKREPPDK